MRIKADYQPKPRFGAFLCLKPRIEVDDRFAEVGMNAVRSFFAERDLFVVPLKVLATGAYQYWWNASSNSPQEATAEIRNIVSEFREEVPPSLKYIRWEMIDRLELGIVAESEIRPIGGHLSVVPDLE